MRLLVAISLLLLALLLTTSCDNATAPAKCPLQVGLTVGGEFFMITNCTDTTWVK